jgi:hypothetical protein
MYNYLLAFVACAFAFVAGEWVSNKTKAWVPSVFVTATIMLLGYWTIFPNNLVGDSNLIPFGNTLAMYLIVTHMGTVISFKQLIAQWKTIVVCLAGLAGMAVLALVICPIFVDRSFIVCGVPPLTGGLVAANIMSDAAKAKGLEAASVFAISMYCIQGFAGYPLTSVCLKLEGKRLLKAYRSGEHTVAAVGEVDEVNGKLADKTPERKKLLPPLPPKYNSQVVMLGKLGIVCWLAFMMAKIPVPGIGSISGLVWGLVLGIVFTSIGFLDENILNKANSYGIVMFALLMYMFHGLKDCTPAMLSDIIFPMVLLIVVGLIGMGIVVVIVSKVMKLSFPMAMATALTALYGFPANALITETTCNNLTDDEDERAYLMGQMFAPMIVGGFTTVTITSVIIAGVFVGFL